ncbi:MAG TPA: sigma-70 family RNA polymerase sigma factor [Xanthobacteraceae bacterium]|nr:sigma-70 family RNA polymerase sigma factor [Xanthobacteraceae bacterium]
MRVFVKQSSAAAETGGPAVTTPADLDEALVREIARGSQLAMRTLFMRHQVRVYRFIMRIVREPALAQDVLSETFLDVWRRAGRFAGRATVSTWLLSIARHKALTAVKSRPTEPFDGETELVIADPALDPEAELREKDRGAILRRCLGELSPQHGEIIDLVYYQEKSMREIADVLRIPVNTVKTRMFYARRRLAAMLAEQGVEPAPI